MITEGNLYVGTSVGEILHFVSLPEDPEQSQEQSSLILASRLELPSKQALPSSEPYPGIQQILLLPRINKACILCSNVVTFYSLPELSPAYGIFKISGCSYIGGRDLDIEADDLDRSEVLMVCVKSRIRLVRLGHEPQPRLVKDIEYPACLATVRRSTFACVADSHSYALLDVDNQQKIPLFPISSIEDVPEPSVTSQLDNVETTNGLQAARTPHAYGYSSPSAKDNEARGHGRSTSFGTFVGNLGKREATSRSRSRDQTGVGTPEGRPTSPLVQPENLNDRPRIYSNSPAERPQSPGVVSLPDRHGTLQKGTSFQGLTALKPHISSPVPSEFLLFTGTTYNEPGVGIFVNCDGDVVRGTLEFSSYPQAVVVDRVDRFAGSEQGSIESSEDGYVLAVVGRAIHDLQVIGLEAQRWDSTTGDNTGWLPLKENPLDAEDLHVGLGVTTTTTELGFAEVGARLQSRRLSISKTTNSADLGSRTETWETTENQQEANFAHQLGRQRCQVVTWQGHSVHWVVRNPLILKLDNAIDEILDASLESRLDQTALIGILRGIKNQEARTETEFLSLQYIRQKICIILFADVAMNRLDVDQQITEKLFLEGFLDPRVILSMVPLLRQDIVEGTRGVWLPAGLIDLMEHHLKTVSVTLEHDDVLSRPEEYDLLSLIKRYLGVWRQRKGFGSIPDEPQVFATVDAALLHILLYQDQQMQHAPGSSSSIRVELYAIVDHDVDCFERAIELLEQFRRLYVLSRLYQSRKMSGKVLATWRRIIDGDIDDGGEFRDGEAEVRKYLIKIKDLALVEEYGAWLARRNPGIGVQVFTDDNSRAKLPPEQVVQLLEQRAPDAVKVYLEHLVFGKKHVQYADRLISYYLDNVLAVLESSEDARSILAQSYESYRALHPPKPTYRQFIVENAIPASWWQDRSRVLDLLGGSHGASFSYDVAKILQRIEPFEDALVPESIILDGRQGRHQQALRLLTHGLGDYHTAINYCLLGGSSIFHPTSGPVDSAAIPSREEQALLFKYLLSEFLRIEDVSDRLERTGELLQRFGSWFDIAYVLTQIPDSWSVQLISAFLVSAFRSLVRQKNEIMITKALSGAQNVKISAELIEKCDELGPQVESVK